MLQKKLLFLVLGKVCYHVLSSFLYLQVVLEVRFLVPKQLRFQILFVAA